MILVAPKGSGTTVRRLFLEGRGINASFAIHQDATGRARDRCLALGIAIGSGYLSTGHVDAPIHRNSPMSNQSRNQWLGWGSSS